MQFPGLALDPQVTALGNLQCFAWRSLRAIFVSSDALPPPQEGLLLIAIYLSKIPDQNKLLKPDVVAHAWNLCIPKVDVRPGQERSQAETTETHKVEGKR